MLMDKYYNIKQWLKESQLDRVYPYDFTDEGLPINSDDNVIVTQYDDYRDIDRIELHLILDTVPREDEDIGLSFNVFKDGVGELTTLTPKKDTEYRSGYNIIYIRVNRNNLDNEVAKLLHNIGSITFKSNGATGTIKEIIFYNDSAEYTLEELDKFYNIGKEYVLSLYNQKVPAKDEITVLPSKFEFLVSMAAGAFAWLSIMEMESAPMKKQELSSNNYADRLLNTVKEVLSKYLASEEKGSGGSSSKELEKLNLDLFQSFQLEY